MSGNDPITGINIDETEKFCNIGRNKIGQVLPAR